MVGICLWQEGAPPCVLPHQAPDAAANIRQLPEPEAADQRREQARPGGAGAHDSTGSELCWGEAANSDNGEADPVGGRQEEH